MGKLTPKEKNGVSFYIVISIILTILNLAFLISISELELDIKNLQMSNINKKETMKKFK